MKHEPHDLMVARNWAMAMLVLALSAAILAAL